MDFLTAWAVAFEIGPLTVRWYGVIICGAMLLGMFLALKETKRQHLNPDDLLNLFIMIIPLALIGARAYYVLVRWDYYGANPSEIIKIWHGGSVIFGGIILCLIGILVYCHIKKQSFFQWVDIIAPELALGQCIGRWGNYVNAEAYGSVIESGSFWSWVPFQVYADGAYHHPLFLYESICDGLIFIMLMVLIHKRHRYGNIFALYLVSYGVVRFFLEFLRQDLLLIGSVRAAHIASVLFILAGLFIMYFTRKQDKIDVSIPAASAKKSKRVGEKKK